MFRYVAAGTTVLMLGAIGYAYYLQNQLVTANSRLAVEKFQLQQCGARLSNLIEDVASDNEIDNLPDSALTVVPDHWLREGAVAPGR